MSHELLVEPLGDFRKLQDEFVMLLGAPLLRLVGQCVSMFYDVFLSETDAALCEQARCAFALTYKGSG